MNKLITIYNLSKQYIKSVRYVLTGKKEVVIYFNGTFEEEIIITGNLTTLQAVPHFKSIQKDIDSGENISIVTSSYEQTN
jgi:hypothetical protein